MSRSKLAAALVLLLGTAAWARAADTVAIGLVVSLAQAPYYVALEKGYFEAAGLAIDSESFRGGEDMTASLATGEIDVGMGAFNAGFLNAANEGLDLRAVAALGYQPAPVIATPPLVLKELWTSGAVRSGKDLRGRKVAVNTPGGTAEYTLSLILDKYAMTLKDVDETMIGFPQMVEALGHKAVDAAFVTSPFAAIPLRDGTAVLLQPDAGEAAGDITTVAFFSGKFLHERPEVGVRFLRALLRGAKETQGPYNRDPATASLLAKATGMRLADIEESVPFAFDPGLDIARFETSIRRQENQHRKDGRLDYSAPMAMSRIVDERPLTAARTSP